MVLNFTDPFLTTRVLGFENLFDRLQRFLIPRKNLQAIRHTTSEEMGIKSSLMWLLLVLLVKTSTSSWQKIY